MVHWTDALHSYPFHNVDKVLRNWLQTQKKAPVIADITKPCADLLSDAIESRAAADKRAFDQTPEAHKATPYGSQVIRDMRAMLASTKIPNKEWARKIMENPNSTELQREFAKPVYATLPQREPGEDDEPLSEAA